MKAEVQDLVREGSTILWESYKLEGFVTRLSDIIFNFQERVDDVLLYTTQIDKLVASLETCEYRAAMFKDVLDQIQKLIDDLNLRSYSNLTSWVLQVDTQVSWTALGRGGQGCFFIFFYLFFLFFLFFDLFELSVDPVYLLGSNILGVVKLVFFDPSV